MRPTATILIASTLTALVAAPLAADVVQAYYHSSTDYGYKILGMKDMDQKRDELPGNGSMYCAPTATMNLFGYAADHGFSISPGSSEGYSFQGYYNHCTSPIFQIGFLMGTDAEKGTKGGWAPGAAAWASGSLLSTHRYSRSSDYTPNVARMTKKAVHGAIVAFNYGRYRQDGVVNGVPAVVRKGGHVVTLSRTYRNGNQRILRYRDPSTPNSESKVVQSDYANTEVSPSAITIYSLSSATFQDRVLLLTYQNDGVTYHRLLDGFLTVKPMYGLTFSSGNDSAATALSTVAPVWFEGSEPPAPSLPMPAGHELVDVAFNMAEDEAVVVTKTGTVAAFYHVGKIDLLSGEYTAFNTTLQPRGVCVGRKHQIYVHNGTSVYRLDQSGNVVDSIVAPPTPSALAYDDEDDELVLLSVDDRKIVRYDENLDPIATHTPAASIPMSGRGWVSVSTSGRIWYATDASNALRGVIFSSGPFFSLETILLPGLVDPTGLVAGNEDELFVTSLGSVKALKKNPRGDWAFNPASPLHGMPGGERMTLHVSRSDLPVGAEEGPEWINIDVHGPGEPIVPEFGDCLGDLDENDVVNGADLAILLGNWGPTGAFGSFASDLDDSGAIDGADLAILLGFWGQCPD
ncbi:MAG: hypothetical protein JNM94_07375 [Phycisphaerae bacterium]|nr:hypothetical protein [Phycisphaerae bacterium]